MLCSGTMRMKTNKSKTAIKDRKIVDLPLISIFLIVLVKSGPLIFINEYWSKRMTRTLEPIKQTKIMTKGSKLPKKWTIYKPHKLTKKTKE
jgi:hypothetical protein